MLGYLTSSNINFCNVFCRLAKKSFSFFNFVSLLNFSCLYFKEQTRHVLFNQFFWIVGFAQK